LTDVPLEEALSNILAAYDYTYIATESMIRVVPLSELVVAREQLVTRIYRITYADANDVATALHNFVSPQGKIALNKGTSHVIVTDTESRIKGIDKFIEEIDQATPQVMVEVRIYDITSQEGFEIGTSWHAGRNTPLKTIKRTKTKIDTDFPTALTETTTNVIGPSSTTSGDTRTDTTQTGDVATETTMGPSSTTSSGDRTDTTTSGGTTSGNTIFNDNRTDTTTSSETTSGNYRDADDGPPSHFTTDGTSTTTRNENSTTTNNQTTSGLATDTRNEDSTTTDSGRTDTEAVQTGDIIQGRTGTSSTTDSGRTETETKVTELPLGSYKDTTTESYITRRRKPFVGGTFDRINGGTLSFSLLDDAVDIDLALSILHQQVEAKLLANPRVLVLDNETAHFEIIREIPYRELRQVAREDPITYTAFKNVGVHLQVTPHIAKDGMIRLHIVPEFGVLVSQDASGIPTVDTRRADTTAMVKDGQTIVIGGLRKRETTKDISKVPVLCDIPIIGGLFQSETESKVTRELVVFITPRIITEPALSETEKKQLDATEFASPKMTKMRLEGDNQPETDVNKPAVTELTELLDMLLQKEEP
jgi:type II secretory pathway component GspD/PulD (secretin)